MLDDLTFAKEKHMVCVLVIGYAPDAVDFTDPAIPPGLTEAIVAEAIKNDLQSMQDRGWEAEHLAIRADNMRRDILTRLAREAYDCIVIGAGVRMTASRLLKKVSVQL